jgi:hypothetical protein
MHRRQYPFPDLSSWPPDEELISRKELAALLQVTEETVKNWSRAGLMPDRVQVMPEGILRDKARFFWRVADLRTWALRMVGTLFRQPARPKGAGRRLNWIAGQGWVEKAPVEPDEQVSKSTKATSKGTKPGGGTSKIPGRVLTVLTRLEGQIAALDRAEEPDEFEEREEPVEVQPRRRVVTYRAEPEPQPFASNCRRPARFGGYWGV